MLTREQRQKVIDLCKDDSLTYKDIGDRFGIGADRVGQIRAEAGLPMRCRSRHNGPHNPRPKSVARPHMMPGLTLSLLMGGRAPRAKLQPA
jgi:hypothetical protein